MSSTSDKHKKTGVDAEVALREAQQRSGATTSTTGGGGGPPQYRLSSLRYWDVRISHTKKYMVAGHFVPSVRGTAFSFMSKKRRLTIELYKPTEPAVAAAHNNNHEQQTKRLFGQLLKGISSSSLMPIPAMGDDDLVALRILKPKLERRRRGNPNTNEEDDGDWDAQSIGSMSLSTLGLAKSPEEDLNFEGPDLRWKERFRCRLDTVQVSDKTAKSCDLTLGEEGSAILKTVHFESKTDFSTFLQVMEQMNQLRAERARRLARSYREARSAATSPTKTSPKHPGLLPTFLGGSPNKNNNNTSPSETQSLLYSDVITIGDSQDETTIEAGGEGGDAIVGRQINISQSVANNNNEEHIIFDPEDPPASDRVQILVEIVAAYNLPIADILASDPYVKVFDGSHEIHRTQVIPKTLNPVWTVGTKSLFLIDQTIEDYFGGSNFISFKIKDYDAIKTNNTLGTVEVSKDDLSQGTGERLAFDVLIPGKTALRRKDLDHPATLALRFRPATPKDILFMEALAVNQKRNKDAVYSIDTFVPPRDHKVSMMKKTNRKGKSTAFYYFMLRTICSVFWT